MIGRPPAEGKPYSLGLVFNIHPPHSCLSIVRTDRPISPHRALFKRMHYTPSVKNIKDTWYFYGRLKAMIPYWCHLLNPLQNQHRWRLKGFVSLETIETWIVYVCHSEDEWERKYLSAFEQGMVVGARRTGLCQTPTLLSFTRSTVSRVYQE
jgi:hypothetical protein